MADANPDLTGLGTAVSGSMNSHAGAGGLDSVVGAVDNSLSALDARAGASAIGLVRRALEYAPGVGGITGTLEQLQQQLQSDRGDGAQIGRLLTALSQQTRDAAGRAGPIAGVLHALAGRLDAAGDRVSRAAGAGPEDAAAAG